MGAGIRPELPRTQRINERWRLRPRTERLNDSAVRLGNVYAVPRTDILRQQEEDLWAAMRSGEAYQGRPKEETAREFSNRMVGDLGRGLLTGRYATPESMIVGQGIENIPVVGDIGTGVRDTGIGIAHTLRGLFNPSEDQQLRGGLAEMGMGIAAALPAVPSMRSLLSRSKALGITPDMVPNMSANTRALERLRPVEANAPSGALTSIRGMSYDEAVDFARGGGHLKVNNAGEIVGAPKGMTLQNINQMRGSLDFHAIRGYLGMDWYERARRGVAEVAGTSAEAQNRLSANLAIHSAGRDPYSNLGLTTRSYSGTAATGEAPRVNYGHQQRAVSEVNAGVDPQDVTGPKQYPFYTRINPQIGDAGVASVNDIWHGRAFGFEIGGKGQPSGFSAAQHHFMDSETLLAAERANAIQLAGRTDWTPERIQAAIWVSKKGESLAPSAAAHRLGIKVGDVKPGMITPADMEAGIREAAKEFSDNFPEYTAYMTNEAVPGAAVGSDKLLQRAGVPERRFNVEQHEGVFSLSQETPNGRAIMSIKDNGEISWSNLPLEQQGKGLGSQMYIEAAQEAERRGTRLKSDVSRSPQAEDLWKRFEAEGFAEKVGDRYQMKPQSEWPDYEMISDEYSLDPNASGLDPATGHNLLLQDVGLLQREGLRSQGVWSEGGRTFFNQAETTRALVGKQNWTLDDPSMSIMDKVSTLQSAITQQGGAAFHTFTSVKGGMKAADINSVRILTDAPPTRAVAQQLNEAVKPYGFEAMHTGDGWTLRPTGDNTLGAPLQGTALQRQLEPSQQRGLLGPRLGEAIHEVLGDVELQAGKYTDKYRDLSEAWAKGEGSGEIVRTIQEVLEAPGSDAATQALKEGTGVQTLAQRQLARAERWGQRLGGTRQDVINMWETLAQPGGLQKLIDKLKDGSIALPVLAGLFVGRQAIRSNDGTQER